MNRKLTVYFINGTIVETDTRSITLDPNTRLLLVNDEFNDNYIFVLDAIRYWKIVEPRMNA